MPLGKLTEPGRRTSPALSHRAVRQHWPPLPCLRQTNTSTTPAQQVLCHGLSPLLVTRHQKGPQDIVSAVSATTRAWVRAARMRLRAELGNQCGQCGGKDHLEFHVTQEGLPHHGTGSASRLSFYRKLASYGLVRLLCPTCHRLAHSKG